MLFSHFECESSEHFSGWFEFRTDVTYKMTIILNLFDGVHVHPFVYFTCM